MNFIIHTVNGSMKMAELEKNSYKIESANDILDVMANAGYQGASTQAVHSEDITPNFFQLKTGIAGEILQKYSNYNNKLAIIGNFTNIRSKSLNDFIYESNNNRQVIFVSDIEEALRMFQSR